MSSLIDSVCKTISDGVDAFNTALDQIKKDNQAIVEKAKTIDSIAKCALVFSTFTALYKIIMMPTLTATLPILFTCILIGYASYEVSTVANNIKNYVTEGFFVSWCPEKSFAENLGLNDLSSAVRAHQIDRVTKNAPLANWLLNFWYR